MKIRVLCDADSLIRAHLMKAYVTPGNDAYPIEDQKNS